MGQNPEDLLTDEEITKVLVATFNKFDTDHSGELEKPEFHKAWKFLGLKGGKDEIDRAFASVDTNYNGVVQKHEFCNAIRNSRLAELGLTVILSQMDGKLDGLEGIFKAYKERLEKAKQDALDNLNNQKHLLERFQATARRRRLMKKRWEEEIAKMTRQLVEKLDESERNANNEKDFELYTTLKDTFNAFDKDGNAELGYPEYKEAWKFLAQPGTEKDIKAAFDSVDVDKSGLMDWTEFVFSIMGEKAEKYGVLADMEKLTGLLDVTLKEYTILKDTLGEVRMDNDKRASRNGELRQRLDGMRSEILAQIGDMMSNMMGLNPEDVLSDEEIRKHLTEVFNKFDKNGNGTLDNWEFKKAWFDLGLKGTEQELNEAFAKVDKDSSGVIDVEEFITAIRNERLMELNLKKVFDKMGVQFAGANAKYEAFAKATRRRRLLKKKMEENIATLTKK